MNVRCITRGIPDVGLKCREAISPDFDAQFSPVAFGPSVRTHRLDRRPHPQKRSTSPYLLRLTWARSLSCLRRNWSSRRPVRRIRDLACLQRRAVGKSHRACRRKSCKNSRGRQLRETRPRAEKARRPVSGSSLRSIPDSSAATWGRSREANAVSHSQTFTNSPRNSESKPSALLEPCEGGSLKKER